MLGRGMGSGLHLFLYDMIWYDIDITANCIKLKYPAASKGSTSSYSQCVISLRGGEARGPFLPDNTGCKRAALKLRDVTLRHGR